MNHCNWGGDRWRRLSQSRSGHPALRLYGARRRDLFLPLGHYNANAGLRVSVSPDPGGGGGYRGTRYGVQESADYPGPGGSSTSKVELLARELALGAWGGGGDISGGNVSRDSEGRYRLGTSNLGPATRRCMDAG